MRKNERPLKPAQVAAILKRDKFTCRKCGTVGVSGRGENDLQVHHVERRTHGGSNKADNLITLCTRCHRKQHPPRTSPAGGDEKLAAFKLNKATYLAAKERLDAEGKTVTEYLVECMTAKAAEPIAEATQVTELALSKLIDRSRVTLSRMRAAGQLDGLYTVKDDGRIVYDLVGAREFFARTPKRVVRIKPTPERLEPSEPLY